VIGKLSNEFQGRKNDTSGLNIEREMKYSFKNLLIVNAFYFCKEGLEENIFLKFNYFGIPLVMNFP